MPDLVVAAVLDHSRAEPDRRRARYDRHGFEVEQRPALEKWAGHVQRLAGGDAVKVIRIA